MNLRILTSVCFGVFLALVPSTAQSQCSGPTRANLGSAAGTFSEPIPANSSCTVKILVRNVGSVNSAPTLSWLGPGCSDGPLPLTCEDETYSISCANNGAVPQNLIFTANDDARVQIVERICSSCGGAEICNGIDDDCDGQIDEGLPCPSCALLGHCDGDCTKQRMASWKADYETVITPTNPKDFLGTGPYKAAYCEELADMLVVAPTSPANLSCWIRESLYYQGCASGCTASSQGSVNWSAICAGGSKSQDNHASTFCGFQP